MFSVRHVGFFASVSCLAAVASCSSSDSVACGSGTVLVGGACVVAAVPIADAGAGDGVATDAPVDRSGPVFDGVAAVAPSSETSLFVTWSDAKDPRTPSSRMKYAIYVAPTVAALDFTVTTATTAPGASSFSIEKLVPNTPYFVGVRAIDEDGVSDVNVEKKSASTVKDTKPPVFDGVKAAQGAGSGSILVTWDAATDDLTPAAAMTYLVYVAVSPSLPDLTTPTLIARTGALSATLTGIANANATYTIIVRARDAAENLDANTKKASATPGVDTTAPTFDGCQSAVATSAGTAVVSWLPAVDETTPASSLAYDVFASEARGSYDFTTPAATVTASSSVVVSGLSPETAYFFVCRARDLAKNEDGNVVERSATTSSDSVAPTFGGLTGATVDPSARTVVLTWNAASDDQTPPSAMLYDVFEAAASQAQDFTAPPRKTSAPGATSITVDDLTPETTLYWIVRARDQGGKRDSNTVELSGITVLSFARNVQPIFSANCAVVGCHVPGGVPTGMLLVPGFAYATTVGVPAGQVPSRMRIAPSDPAGSYLYEKITATKPTVGQQMPAPATGNVLTAADKEIIRRWIAQGAPNN
jgi:hypothetical protein